MGWESFTVIQDLTIEKIYQTQNDIIVSAATASGKTEAAFLPILSIVESTSHQHLKILYISPLKALINNQFERITELCDEMDININRWHGDVAASKKKKFIKDPTGILQITPESIESLFINRSPMIKKIFEHLDFIIIDEIHSFIGTDRGAHLNALLARLMKFATNRPRIVGLSATIDNFKLVKNWVNPIEPEKVSIVQDTEVTKRLLYYLMYISEENKMALFEDLRELTAHNKSIIFCNQRADVEETTVFLNRLANKKCYYPHHASIDKSEREFVERIMMNSQNGTSIVATGTLELGIDIGNIDLVVQIDSTFTVSSLKQRLGRSGRKQGADQCLQLYATNENTLLQALAVMELNLEKWVEPVTSYELPYDIAFHQIVSICAEKNGLLPNEIIQSILEIGIFKDLNEVNILELLKHMLKENILEQISGSNEYIVGIEGEKLLRSKEFYSVFVTNEEFLVVEGTKKIGQIARTSHISEEDTLILSGKLWVIQLIDFENSKIYVERTISAKKPRFDGDSIDIHQRIGEKMYELLCTNDEFHYIDVLANSKLMECRTPYYLAKANESERMVWKYEKGFKLDVYSSTRILRTLVAMLKFVGATNVSVHKNNNSIVFKTNNINELQKKLLTIKWSAQELLAYTKIFNSKYLKWLPDNLQAKMKIVHEFDVDGTKEFLEKFPWNIEESSE